jgi:hypothetical protein
MNVRHMSVSVVGLGTPRRGSGAIVGIVPKPRGVELWDRRDGEVDH